MASQAEVAVRNGQHLAINRTMRLMPRRASLAQGSMFKDFLAALLPVATGARLVQARHGQAPAWFENVAAMRIVTLHAAHLFLQHRMVLRQGKLALDISMTSETGLRAAPWVDDKLSSGRFHVPAGWPVASFTTVVTS